MNYTTNQLSDPPRPGEFCGVLPGLETVTDPAAWPAAVKANPPIRSGKPSQPAVRQQRTAYAFPARVTLTKLEEEWLGATVYAAGDHERPWQVWSLGCLPGYVWLVRDGETLHESVKALSLPTRPAGRASQTP